MDLRALVDDPTATPRRLLVLLDHLPADSPLALSVGPEWWWGRDTHAQLLGAVIDALNVVALASTLPASALGVKGPAIAKALGSVKPWERPTAEAAKPQTFEQKIAALMTSLGGV